MKLILTLDVPTAESIIPVLERVTSDPELPRQIKSQQGQDLVSIRARSTVELVMLAEAIDEAKQRTENALARALGIAK
jgi:hypothetical protein